MGCRRKHRSVNTLAHLNWSNASSPEHLLSVGHPAVTVPDSELDAAAKCSVAGQPMSLGNVPANRFPEMSKKRNVGRKKTDCCDRSASSLKLTSTYLSLNASSSIFVKSKSGIVWHFQTICCVREMLCLRAKELVIFGSSPVNWL
jgi:hypothetical protein